MKTFFIACILLSAYAVSLESIFDEVIFVIPFNNFSRFPKLNTVRP
jgi:hypothetical protein